MQIDGALRTDVANRSRSRPVAPCTARQLPTLEFIPWGQMDTKAKSAANQPLVEIELRKADVPYDDR